jgi:hypothetical protein
MLEYDIHRLFIRACHRLIVEIDTDTDTDNGACLSMPRCVQSNVGD